MQLPLVLAFAMSIHKSQGQTLERVRIDLGRYVSPRVCVCLIANASTRIFEYGQAYVAISRCTSLQGLQVIGFDPSRIRVHEKVVQFYKKLENVVKS